MNDVFRPLGLVWPKQVEFGCGCAGKVGDLIERQGGRRVLVVADAFNADRLSMLGLKNVDVSVFDTVKPEPDIPNLDCLLAAAAAFAPDTVVGFGGGSAMDLAKLVVVLHDSGQLLADVVGPHKTKKKSCWLVQVPTTAGTGSEAGIRALVTDPVSTNKMAVESLHMLADLAVIDPDLMISIPAAVTAATGIDALAHCVEVYTNRKAHPIIDLLVMEGIRLVGQYLPRAVADGTDRDARAAMALASFYGGIGLGPVNTAAGHAVAYPLGSRHHIPHGAANALIFPHVLAFNAPAVPERTEFVLKALGVSAPVDDEGAVRAAACAFCQKLGLTMTLSDWNVPESDLPFMAAQAHAIRRLLDNNPRDLSEARILAMYRAAFR